MGGLTQAFSILEEHVDQADLHGFRPGEDPNGAKADTKSMPEVVGHRPSFFLPEKTKKKNPDLPNGGLPVKELKNTRNDSVGAHTLSSGDTTSILWVSFFVHLLGVYPCLTRVTSQPKVAGLEARCSGRWSRMRRRGSWRRRWSISTKA